MIICAFVIQTTRENNKIKESEMGSNEIKEIALSDSFEEKSAENNQNESKNDKKEEN